MLGRLTSKSLHIALMVLGELNFYTPRACPRLPELDYRAK